VPHLAKGWEASDDKREWTIFLRQGAKWSDGHPFTADDIMYWWEEEHPYFNSLPVDWMVYAGKEGEIEKIDDYTLKFSFHEPNPRFLETLAQPGRAHMLAPRHYLRQFHPEHGDQALIEASRKAMGADNARAVYWDKRSERNPECPRLWPWVYQTYKPSPPVNFVRNPYYFAVDIQGNQLPYVDRLLFEVKRDKFIPIAAASGDITMQSRDIDYKDYTLLMENREKNGYEIYHWFSSMGAPWSLWPNQNRRVIEGDPESKNKATLLNEKTFRQALSLAINREDIIRAIWHGRGEPSQLNPPKGSDYHFPDLAKAYTQYDPARANEMLDALGLDQRDSEGMRTFPDGSRMTWYIDYTAFTGEGSAQFIVDDWAEVGVRAIQRERARGMFSAERAALLHDFTVWSGESDFDPIMFSRSFVPTELGSHFAPAYGQWYLQGGFYGAEGAKKTSKIPKRGTDFWRGYEILDDAMKAESPEEQVRIFREAMELAAENVYTISVVTPPPVIAVVKDGFKGVPRKLMDGFLYATPGNGAPDTFFFENPSDSPGAIAQIKQEIAVVTPNPNTVDTDTLKVDKGDPLARLLGTAFALLAVIGVILVGVRHPYIGRRFLIMVPTLGVISVVVFYIIQLPPGDFVETRILQLQLSGDEAAIEDVKRLRDRFHLDEPVWRQYVRWLGLKWIVSFDAEDKGLLQGEMGRSMSTGRSVNDMVGDRVTLTFLVSLGTIIFTWVIALPIGIYSAARQYSVGDYVLTFIGFIGMCIPNFLFAIILMFISSRYLGINVTGLFSPEYAAMPEWTWGKIVDLLQHIWVPIVVIAASGTAGMIRVMRGNLLDELRKPYVTTALAKGVRPFKLLMKYPVRVALNPFVSGIGAIFPQLVSGGAIVAIVLSLPMVGPLLLEGLMTEDVYLAGSMLMVLSLLGIVGTLVSDLLLIWLDPRISMKGGGK